MKAIRAVLAFSPMYAFVERSFGLIRRYWAWEMVFLFYTVINTLTIGLIGLSGNVSAADQQQFVLYLVIGALFWGFMSVLFEEVSNSITWERWEGTIEYTFMAPVHRITHLFGMCMFAILYGIFRTVIVLLVVALFFDLTIDTASLLRSLVVLFLGSPAFMGLGIIASVLPLLSPEKGAQGTHIIQGIIMLVSGIYYPVEVLPVWLHPIAYASPGTYALEGARATLLEGATLVDIMPALLKMVGIGVVLIPLGLWIFSIAEKHAMRTGKLKRNG
ncbi:ABC transporter permease [Mechercharimyces sp. CAU 1602]|uniref:ABC transporter permease n=1 Tax=Mechercharimyces sp. CAU 1602 TaxID=2973933 RepID=UPI00216292BC|nr:ABC transporter permease [Mechercharimyces sp. CAU 1602]MCS1352474.1 ABC transporter permease [Mechercharimyces sp. CAU 1602]